MKCVHSLYSMMIVAAAVLAVASPVLAQDSPRTGWGDPDLQGVWDFRTITPLQRPEALGEQEFLTKHAVIISHSKPPPKTLQK